MRLVNPCTSFRLFCPRSIVQAQNLTNNALEGAIWVKLLTDSLESGQVLLMT